MRKLWYVYLYFYKIWKKRFQISKSCFCPPNGLLYAVQAKQLAPIAEGEGDPTPEAIERTLTSSVAHRVHRMIFAGRTMLFNGDVGEESQVDGFAAALLKVHI